MNVKLFVQTHGLEKCAFFTLTVPDHVSDPKEFQRRLNNLLTNVLRPRYGDYVLVPERHKSGRLHCHLIVNVGQDIRTGADFEAFLRGDYRTASPALRQEWAFWRSKAKGYGFGRTELLPIKSSHEGVARYVGKYIAKNIDNRQERDRGVRLVRYSRGAGLVQPRHVAWNSPRATLWRRKLAKIAMKCGFTDLEDFKHHFGAAWAWSMSDMVVKEPLESYPYPEAARADGHQVPQDAEGAVTVKVTRNPDYFLERPAEWFRLIDTDRITSRIKRERDAWARDTRGP